MNRNQSSKKDLNPPVALFDPMSQPQYNEPYNFNNAEPIQTP